MLAKIRNVLNPIKKKHYRNSEEIYRNKFNFNEDPNIDEKIE